MNLTWSDPALGSARNHQGRPWLGPGTGTPVEVRVGPRHRRPRTRIQKEPGQRDLLLRNTHNPRGDTNGLRSLASSPAARRAHMGDYRRSSRSSAAPTPERLNWVDGAVSAALIRRLPASGGRRWSMACATFWHPTGPQDRHGRPSSLPPTPRDRHDVTRPSHATGSSPTTKKQANDQAGTGAISEPACTRSGTTVAVPAEAAGARLRPRSRARRRVQLVVPPGSIPAADPDPPPGTRDLPGHHPRAGHSRARLNSQHPGVQRQVLSDPHLEPDQIGHPRSRSRRPPPHAATA